MKKSLALLVTLLALGFSQSTFAEAPTVQAEKKEVKVRYSLQLYIDGKLDTVDSKQKMSEFPVVQIYYGSNLGQQAIFGENPHTGEGKRFISFNVVPTKTKDGIALFGNMFGKVGNKPKVNKEIDTVVQFGSVYDFSFEMDGKTYTYKLKPLDEV